MANEHDISVPFGLLRLGKIESYDLALGTAQVSLSHTNESVGKNQIVNIPIPNSFYSSDGIFVGTLAKRNTSVILGRGEDGWYFVSFLVNNPTKVPTDLSEGTYLLQSNSSTKVSLDIKGNINLGSTNNKLHLDTKRNLFSSTFNNKLNFTEASREVNGVIKRDLKPNSNFPSSLKLTSDEYDQYLYPISLDPTASSASSFTSSVKNPPLVEKRELVYEFANSYGVKDDLTESQLYQKSGLNVASYNLPDRRESRSDTLSLSLVAPNYLMETVKGTVVDIFGNILDINRFPIPVGTKDLTLREDESGHIKDDAFNKIKAAQRKSLAFHFELNAKKDLAGKNGQIKLPDISSKDDYARNRSRFFVDIDKEGLFKINVPASSETGNVPLLTRYENYSTFGTEDNNNPNKLVFIEENRDIFHDSFATGDITIKDGNAVATPKDRIDDDHIKHGTAYHSISNSLSVFKTGVAEEFLGYEYNEHIGLSSFPTLENVVTDTIYISGAEANAGGRSGSINLDGSLELSIGANSVDRQSLWLDTQGGIVANIGRDKQHISAAFSLDGDLLVQIGGETLSNDSRFNKVNNAYRQGVLDIRVLNEGFTVSIIRIDKDGITVATPGTLRFKGRDVNISAEADLVLEGDNVSINERLVGKFPVTSI